MSSRKLPSVIEEPRRSQHTPIKQLQNGDVLQSEDRRCFLLQNAVGDALFSFFGGYVKCLHGKLASEVGLTGLKNVMEN